MFTINVELRPEAEQGKGASRRLRTENKFPAIVYGGSAAPVSIKLDHDSVKNMEVKAEFYSGKLLLWLSTVKIPWLKFRLYSVTRSSQNWLTSTSFAFNR